MPFIPYKTRPGFYYVYDMNRNSVLKINEMQYEALGNLQSGHKDEKDLAILKSFQGKGLLLESPVKKIEHPATAHLKYQLDRCVNSVTFQITQNCNLRCQYCPYSDNGIYEQRSHTKKIISWETIAKGIDFMIEHSKESDILYVSFYGGEPLLNKELVLRTMQYTTDRVKGKKVLFGITTNATLLDERFVESIKDFDISITVSLDGPQDVHDKNRSFINGDGSYHLLYKNITHIKEKYPKLFGKLKYNTVLSPNTNFKAVWDFFRNNNDICDLSKVSFTQLSTNYTNQILSYEADFYEEWNYEVLKAYLILLGRLPGENILHYKDNIERILVYKEFFTPRERTAPIAHPGGTCIPGLKKLFVDVHGDFYPCERADDKSKFMKIGNIDDGFDVESVKELLNVGKVTEESCKECWAFHCCTICPVVADNGKDEHYSKNFKLKQCSTIKNGALEKIKNYTMLREFNYEFRTEDLKI